MKLLESQKSTFSVFPVLKVLNKIKKKLKTIQNFLSCKTITFQAIPTKAKPFFRFFTENVTLLLPVTRCAGHNTQTTFKKQYLENGESEHCLHKNIFEKVFDALSNDIQVDRFCTCGSLVIDAGSYYWNYWNLKNRVFQFFRH